MYTAHLPSISPRCALCRCLRAVIRDQALLALSRVWRRVFYTLSIPFTTHSLHDEKKGVVDSFKPLYSSSVIAAKQNNERASSDKDGTEASEEEQLEHTPDGE